MEKNVFLSLLIDLLTGGTLSLLSASLSAHFGFRAADRLPGESRLPQCFFCLRSLQVHEYFPLFGWLLRKNPKSLSCPCGKKKGLWPQPLVEIIGFFLGCIAVGITGWSPLLIPVCLALGLLPAIALIDLSFGIIPDELNITLGLFGFISLILGEVDLFLRLVGVAGLLGLGLLLAIGYSKLRGREMLGLGDVKFFAAAGFWLPITTIPWFLVLAGVFGSILGIAWSFLTKSKEFPFAPALCLSLACCLFYQLYLFATP